MTYEQITMTIRKEERPLFEIKFKGRASIKGLFVKNADAAELNRKNFWRIVHESRIAEYEQTGNEELARIFYGDGFARLVLTD